MRSACPLPHRSSSTRSRARAATFGALGALLAFAAPAAGRAQDLLVNGGFEALDATGWTAWQAPWSAGVSQSYAWATEPFDGESSLHLMASSGSFGVYQELCVEAGVPLIIDWAWRGATAGNGWFEVLLVDAPYSYEAVDDPGNHPETMFASKWEVGFGGAYPEPSAEWVSESFELTPTSERVTLVLKCGSVDGGHVEADFDAVAVSQETEVLAVTSITPPLGKTAGGDLLRIGGRVFPEGATVTFGAVESPDATRLSTCELSAVTPPGEAGVVDVIVAVEGRSTTIPGGFRYVPPPAIASITPSSGPAEGGTPVRIEGAAFVGLRAGDIRARIGARALLGPVVEGEDAITGETPAGDPGPADVLVTTPFGEVTLAGGFTYTSTPASSLFQRGDCNGDGIGNITDGVALLNYLFVGTGTIACLEACNVDDGAVLNLTDAVGILGYLFLGAAAPAPPFPDCGGDPTPEQGTSCEASQEGCS